MMGEICFDESDLYDETAICIDNTVFRLAGCLTEPKSA